MSHQKELYRLLFETTSEAMLVMKNGQSKFSWVVVDCNASAASLFGADQAELLGQTLLDFSPPAQVDGRASSDLLQEKIEAALLGESQRFDWLYQDSTGQPLLAEMALNAVQCGQETYVQASVRNIDQHKQTEATLRRSDERLRAFVNTLPDIAFIVDEAGRYLDVLVAENNPRYATAAEKLMGRLMPEIMPADKAERLLTAIREVIERQQPQTLEYSLQDPPQIWYEGRILPMEAEPGEMKTVLLVARDITERKRTEEELRRLSVAVEQSANTVVITDTRGYIEYVNPKFTETTGYTREEALGQHTRILKSGETSPDAYRELWQTISAGQGWRGEFHNRKKNGELYWELATISPIKDEQGNITHFLAVKEEITERKRLEQALQESERRLANIIDFLPYPTFAIDTAGKVIAWNQACETVLGVKTEEILGQDDYAYALPFYGERRPILIDLVFADPEEIEQNYLNVRREGQVLSAEAIVYPQGQERYFVGTAAPLYDAQGNIAGAIETFRDITEQKQIQEALRDSEARYSAMVEQSNDGIVIIQGNLCQFVNRTLADMLGYHAAEMEDTPFINYLAPESRELVAARVKARLAGEDVPPVYEARLLRKDGTTFEAELSAGVIQYRGEVADVGLIRNITQRKRAEEAVRESQQMLQLIMDNIPQSIFWKDKELIYLGCNQNFARDTGLNSADEVIGKTDFEMPWLDQAELYRADDRRVMEAGEAVLGYEEPQTTPDGSQIWLRTSKVPLRDAMGKVTAVLGMYEDITERKQIEAARQESEQRLADIIDFLPTPTFVIDLEGNVIAWNQAIVEVTGVKAEDILGKGEYEYALPFFGERRPLLIDLVFEPEEEVAKKYTNVRREGNSLVAENRVYPRGIERHYLLSAAPLYDARGKLVGAIENFRDITEQKRAETELQEYQDQLEALVAARTAELEERVRELNTLQQLMSREGWQEFQASRKQAAPGYLFDQAALRPVERAELELSTNGRSEAEGAVAPVADKSRRGRPVTKPLAVSGESIGTLGIYDNDPDNPLSPEDQAFLDEVAAQVAEALERARLLEQSQSSLAATEEQARRLALLSEMSRELTTTNTIEEAFTVAATRVVEIVGGDWASIALVIPDTDKFEVHALSGPEGVVPTGTVLPVAGTAIGRSILENRVVIETEASTSEYLDARHLAAQGIRSTINAPLVATGQVFGTINVARAGEQPGDFTEQEERLMLQVASLLASTIESRRLFEQTQLALAEVEATQRRYTVQAWEAYQARQRARSYEQDQEGVPPLGEQLPPEVSRAVAEKKAVAITAPPALAVGKDKTQPPVVEAKSSLVVPLTVRDEVIGVLGLQETDQARQWTPEEIALVEAIAEQVAQAAEQIRLFDETQQRAAREQRVGEIGDKIRAAHSLEEALQVAIKEVGLSLKAPQTTVKLEVE